MKLSLPYGRRYLTVHVPDDAVVIEPYHQPGLVDEKEAFLAALRSPIGTPPLRKLVRPSDRVVIVTSDGTRPTPNERIIPWLLDELPYLPRDRVTVLVGSGTHRPNTTAELEQMFGRAVLEQVQVINHSAYDPESLVLVGEVPRGGPVWLNRTYVEASVRIAVGFIEPHFFAGFSGGPKAVCPGVAGIETIMWAHGAALIGDPRATWGNLDENPVHLTLRSAVELCPPQFLVNVTLNTRREITGVYAGDLVAAHRAGAEACRRTSMRAVASPFDVIMTTNGGFPLDQNLYQTVKGLSAAARIVRPGGAILCISECSDGIPAHGRFGELLREGRTPDEWLRMLESPGFRSVDQWQLQVLAMVLKKAKVYLASSLPKDDVRAAGMIPVATVEQALSSECDRHKGDKVSLAVLPWGPLTVPYVAAI